MIQNDTICAIATAQGGAIGIIRISGKQSIEITSRIFISPKKKILSEQKTYTLTYGEIISPEDHEIIDEVLVALYRAPHSYTGEDCIEIMCHGSHYILQKVMQLLIQNGCRSAMPGEYTQRAFLNGKLDLSQAEAVADLIASSSKATHQLAMNQMRGGFSQELSRLRNQLIDFTAMIELELDFGEEDVEFANRKELLEFAEGIYTQIHQLASSFQIGNVLKNGIPIAIVGETNAGKSTLLNLLLNDDKAIVSDIHGTTRDVIEDVVELNGITFRFIDTAGLRQTNDTIENIGIELTYKKIDQASIILWVIDSTQINEHIEWMTGKIIPRSKNKRLILVFNKIDNVTEEEQEIIDNLFVDIDVPKIHISAKQHTHINQLIDLLTNIIQTSEISKNNIIITNTRHYEALVNAEKAIIRIIEGIKQNTSGDFLSQDIRECIHYLGEITGEITTDDVLGNIFKNFCIGK